LFVSEEVRAPNAMSTPARGEAGTEVHHASSEH